MSALQPVRGTRDLLPDDMSAHRNVAEQARQLALRYGFREIATPILEFTEIFARTLGVTSDVVSKEMYSFADKGGAELTMRPENTAGVARAFISNGLAQTGPQRFFYYGPMFRRERPQKGRQRQFHQIGVELLGVADPLADVEIIACAYDLLRALKLSAPVTLELNTLGDGESRERYRAALSAYLADHAAGLSADSQRRLIGNPLRILDSKDEGDRRIVADAPLFDDYLNDVSRDFFNRLRDGLTALDIPWRANPHLVRGLDYYCHTAFEFTTDALGAQGTVLAGGRYDGLIAQLGGPPTPGVGWAAGVERLAMLAAAPPAPPPPVMLIPLGTAACAAALRLAQTLRDAGIRVETLWEGGLGKRLKLAARGEARHALLLGEDELARGVCAVRNLQDGAQRELPLAALPAMLPEQQA